MAFIGRDDNQAGSGGNRASVSIPDAYYTGIVEDIIYTNKNGKYLKYNSTGSNLGQIKVRIIPLQYGVPGEELNDAYPIEINIRNFPLVGEQVILFKVGKVLFYSRLATRRNLTENRDIVAQRRFSEEVISEENERDARELVGAGVPSNYSNTGRDESESTFVANPSVRPVRSYEGDLIFQGRFGNIIRFGSSAFQNPNVIMPEPNIILTAGCYKTPPKLSTETITPYSLTEESINDDDSSIWMVANQEVLFKPATRDVALSHLVTSTDKTPAYIGAQIFINSDRVILNSKKNEISLFSNNEINLSSVKDITLNTDQNISLRAYKDIEIQANRSLFLKAEDLTILATKNLSVRTAGDYGISGERIFIGTYGDATQPMVLGTNLGIFMGALISNLITLNTALAALATAATSAVGVPPGSPLVGINAAGTTLTTAIGTVQTTLALLFAGTGFTAPIPGKGAIFNSKSNFVSVGKAPEIV